MTEFSSHFHYKHSILSQQNDVNDDAVEENPWTEIFLDQIFHLNVELKFSLNMSHVKPDDDYNNNVHDREKREKKKLIKI